VLVSKPEKARRERGSEHWERDIGQQEPGRADQGEKAGFAARVYQVKFTEKKTVPKVKKTHDGRTTIQRK